MPIISFKPGLAIVVAMLMLSGPMAHGQVAPVNYWIPGWFSGFDSNPADNANTYGNFPSFDGRAAAGGGFANTRYNFSNGWFVGTEGGGLSSMNLSGIGQNSFGSLGSVSYQGAQFGYSFQKSNDLPISVYAGFDTLKYNAGIGSNPFAPFDTTSGTLPVYSARAGIEFRPTSNITLGLGVGYTQQSGRIDGDINGPSLVGPSPFAVNGRR
jgi:opacity protein-like surface antigen